MTNILITGEGSYIGTSFAAYMQQWPQDYQVDTVDMIGDNWRNTDFSVYDAVFHVAGIAHIKETAENAYLYYEVNRDLAVETAQKAKDAGVKHFVFLSSMSIYGLVEGIITADTQPAPNTNYGKSKWQAERQIAALCDDTFAVSVLRPPMVYGDNCKGNYQALVKLAKIAPFCPNYVNERSMVSIATLCSYVKNLIDRRASGIFFPQEEAYICTCRMIADIAEQNGKKLPLIRLLNPAVSLAKMTTKGKKAFGNLTYAKELSTGLPL